MEKKILFQSSVFVKLILTEEHYLFLKARLTHITSFKKEMQLLEIWLQDHPKRRTKNYRLRVTNWMKKAEQIAVAEINRQQRRWNPPKSESTLTVYEADNALKSIKEILNVEAKESKGGAV